MFTEAEKAALSVLVSARITAKSADLRHFISCHGMKTFHSKKVEEELKLLRSILVKLETV